MTTDYDSELLKEGILHFKAGETSLAKRYLERALDVADDNPTRATACYYLSLMTEDAARKRWYLEQTLAINPVHPEARRSLAILDGRLKPEEIINPDAIPVPAPGMVNVSADRFTCPKCGGRMVYTADGKTLNCEFCARTQDLSAGPAEEQDFFAAMASGKGHKTAVSTQVFHCQGCGAEFILEAREISAACTWCGSVHVIQQSRTFAAPDSILPFGFDQRVVESRLQEWVKERSRRPLGSLPIPRPLYLPVWCFNILAVTPWSGQVHEDGQHLPVSGEDTLYLNDIAIPAVKKYPRLLSALLEGFNFSVTSSYDSRFLAGWSAQVPSISLSDAALEARRIALKQVRRTVRSQHGKVMNLRHGTASLSVDTYRLVLIPVWLAEIPLQDSVIPVAVNGITGTVHSDSPAGG